MSIVRDVEEFRQLDLEIKRRNKELYALRKRRTECEKKIIQYLEVNEQPGLKYKDVTIINKPKKLRSSKKGDKLDRIGRFLEERGVYLKKDDYTNLLEVVKGPIKERPAISL
jgi:hypothetical protein